MNWNKTKLYNLTIINKMIKIFKEKIRYVNNKIEILTINKNMKINKNKKHNIKDLLKMRRMKNNLLKIWIQLIIKILTIK